VSILDCVLRDVSSFTAGPPPDAKQVQHPKEDPQLFTEACLHGLRVRLSEDVDALDSYLPPHVAEMARKVAAVLEEPQPAPA
jgi:hypothetical protein